MYQIYADDTLIYDSTLEDYKIGSGQITKELDKAGSFVFSLYPDHPYYNSFVKLKTVVTVKKSGKIVFRGRVLNDATDYWNTGTFTCEGELSFLRDSVIRPFEFQGKPADLFKKFIDEHNAGVDEFKRFKVGSVSVNDANDYINRSTYEYPTTLAVMNSALTDSALGGHFYITHGDDETDPMPTIHYVADFPKTATQAIEFGVNLRNYTKTATAEEVATAIIPLGSETETTGQRLTIKDVNGGKDYVYNQAAVALYGWVFKTVVWEDVTLAQNLKTKAEEYLEETINQNVTIELNAIDLHLLDRSIESFNVCEYVHVTSQPHDFDATLLCNKQTMDLLNPERDTVVLGYHAATFTEVSSNMAANVSTMGKTFSTIRQDAENILLSVEELDNSVTGMSKSMAALELRTDSLSLSVTNGSTSASIQLMTEDEDGNPQTVGNKVTIQMNGLVTFAGLADGTTSINGGCIDTGYISASRIQAGTITLGKLSTSVQNAINGAVSEDDVATIITEELVSAPTVRGGVFEDRYQNVQLELDGDAGAYSYGLILRDLNDHAELFSIWNSGAGLVSLYSLGTEVLSVDKRGIIYATGTWDFTGASVYGI